MFVVNGIWYLYGKMLLVIKWKENYFFFVFCDWYFILNDRNDFLRIVYIYEMKEIVDGYLVIEYYLKFVKVDFSGRDEVIVRLYFF